jgi:hypothetical protein
MVIWVVSMVLMITFYDGYNVGWWKTSPQQKVPLYAKWFYWILCEFISPNEGSSGDVVNLLV